MKLTGAAAFAAVVVAVSIEQSFAQTSRFSPGSTDRSKVRVDDAIMAGQLVADGAVVVADYGSFRVLEVNASGRAALQGHPAVESIDEHFQILLNAGGIDARAPKSASRTKTPSVGAGLHLVQFAGPVKPEWVDELKADGFRIVAYIPHNAYLVYGDASARAGMNQRAASRKHVQWEGAYTGADKIQPRAKPVDRKGLARVLPDVPFAIQLVDDEAANDATIALITALAGGSVEKISRVNGYVNVIAKIPATEVASIAELPDVVSINLYTQRRKFDERQGQIVAGNLTGNAPTGPGYLSWLATKGFTNTVADFAVNVTDSGVDNGTSNANHFALYTGGSTALATRVVYNRLEGTANTGSTIQGCDGHGNINAHIIGGYVAFTNAPHVDSGGYRYGLGIAPFVKIGSSVIFDPSNFTSPDYEDLISRAYRDGARVSSDSWGADTAGDYDIDAQQYDALVRDAQPAGSAVVTAGNQEMTIVFAAGNAGSGAQTVGSPGTAKNVITVGAAENVHSHAITNGGSDAAGNDGCSTPDSEANSANDIASFSSRGPCSDQRQKPEIVAPGTHITGGVAQQNRIATGTGDDLSCFSAEGVCATASSKFFPTNQQFYSTSSGTSHSTPAVAGGVALIRTYFQNNGINAPSPAMVKAYLVNSARYMTGTDANDNLWSPDQGMGGMNLGTAFDGTPRMLRDQRTNDIFTTTGQSRTFTGQVVSNTKPVRVTLSWTDAPGSTSGNAFNNDLNLTVVINGQTYRGNVFTGAFSTTGGSSDARNNTESIFLPAGTTGVVSVTVSGANITSDGIPNFGTAIDQDFALVIYNAVEVQAPAISDAGSFLSAESCGVGNAAIDPDETVTVYFTLQNSGSADTTNVVATLLATGGVTAPSSAVSYGALLAGGSAVSNAFTFTATGTCGGAVTATLSLQDGATSLGSITYNFQLGGTSDSLITRTNATAINIRDNTTASPYPSTITITGAVGTISKVVASLNGFGHAYPEDIDMVLVSPGGQKVALMGAVGGGTSVSGLNIVFDDDASASISEPMASGTFKPSGSVATMTSPAPGAPYGATMSEFNGVSPNGTWSLYVLDAAASDTGRVVSGWTLSVTAGEPLCCGSNKPPVLAAIGNQSVTLSNSLSFAVTATDPYDADPITLVASNLPAGATFGATNGNGTFSWSPASPTGTYNVSFYATDDDGVDSETISITVSPIPVIGPSTNIAGWTLIQSNATLRYTFLTNATIASGGYLILARSATKVQFESYWGVTLGSNVTFITASNETPTINGAETYTLHSVGSVLRDGPTPTSLDPANDSVRRISAQSNATLAASWLIGTALANATPGSGGSGNGTGGVVISEYSDATGTGAFSNEFVELFYDAPSGPAPQNPPTLASIGNKTVVTNSTLSFNVTATPTEGDTVTLTASNLPAGATFSSTNENGAFEWVGANPLGVYTTTFYATDNDGVSSETIEITVAEGLGPTNVTVLYTFDAASAFTNGPNTVPAGLSAGLFVSGDGIFTNFGGNPGRAIADSGFTGTGNNYFTCTITISSGLVFNLKSLRFDDQRSNSGPAIWTIQSSADSFASDLAAGSSHLSFSTNDAALSVTNITGAFTLRISGGSAGSAGGTWRIDNVAISGELSTESGSSPDADGDGLDDEWEILYFGSTTNANATTDSDGDFFVDLHEFLAGTVPTNGGSLLVATQVVNDASGFVVTWQSASNRFYTLSRASDLLGTFTNIALNIPATPPSNVYTDAVPTNAVNAYRVEVE